MVVVSWIGNVVLYVEKYKVFVTCMSNKNRVHFGIDKYIGPENLFSNMHKSNNYPNMNVPIALQISKT